MRSRSRTLMVAATAALFTTLFVPAASAAVSCTFTPASGLLEVDMPAQAEFLNLFRTGKSIDVGAACAGGTPTVNNTDLVRVTGSNLDQTLTLNMTNGIFAPGKTAEGAGKSEIEFDILLGLGSDELRITGTNNDDNMRVGSAGINWNGDADRDIEFEGVDYLKFYGQDGDDVISGVGGNGTGQPSTFEILMRGDDGNDRLTGGKGSDELEGSLGSDGLTGGLGEDYLAGLEGNDSLRGGDDDDSIYPGPGADEANGDAGDDGLKAEDSVDGADVYRGGTGNDYVDYSGRTADQVVKLDGKPNDGLANEKDNVSGDVETIYGGSGADELRGNNSEQNFQGNDGDDVIMGLGGDDSLNGDAGADDLQGGDGDDSHNGDDEFDTANGGAGDDSFAGGTGNDVLTGGTGADKFFEGNAINGADEFIGGLGRDTVSYEQRSIGLQVTLDNGANDGVPTEFDNVRKDVEFVFGGTAGDVLNATAAAGFQGLYGQGGGDTLYGGSGDDTLVGAAGLDIFYGGDGYDAMYGNDDADTAHMSGDGRDFFNAGAGIDTCTDRDAHDQYPDCENA